MDQMQAALAHLKALEKPNYAATARQFKVDETTLRRRFLGLAASRADKASKLDKNLTSAQEEVLLGYIDKLTARHIPPTTQIIKNLAEELLRDSVGKNWTARFCKRYQDRICSHYLKPLNCMRVASERFIIYEHFYTLVQFICVLLQH